MYDDYFMQFFFKKPNMTSCYLKKLFCGNTFYKKTYRCNIHIHFFDNVNTQGNNSTGNVISSKQTVVEGYFLNH